MPPKKASKENAANSVGSIPFFQIFIFLIATVSMAINVGIITGKIPIKGKLILQDYYQGFIVVIYEKGVGNIMKK